MRRIANWLVLSAAAIAAVGTIAMVGNVPRAKAKPVAARPVVVQPRPTDRVFATPGQPLDLAGAPVAVKSLLAVPGPMHFGDAVWNDRGVPPGRLWIRVDRRAQLVSVFRGPHEIGTAVILYGAPEKPTPAGLYPILEKRRVHRSTLYDADMPYTLRLTGDGISIHASTVRQGAATHGCIGLPGDFAARLFDQAKAGDPVVIV